MSNIHRVADRLATPPTKDTSAPQLPPELAAIAAGRTHIPTGDFAHVITRSAQTIRKNYCLTGDAYGVVPIKLGNGLLWPVHRIAGVLRGDR